MQMDLMTPLAFLLLAVLAQLPDKQHIAASRRSGADHT
jgi:hypothetical protein